MNDDQDIDPDGLTPAAGFIRICSKCSVQTSGQALFCPNCGTAFEKKNRPSKKLLLAVAGILVLVGIIAGTVISVQKSSARAAEESAAAASSSAAAAASSSAAVAAASSSAEVLAAAESAQAEIDTEKAMRTVSVVGMEASIEKDAKERVKKGSIDGPIQRVSCTPTGNGSMDDLTNKTTSFECIAVNKKDKDGQESGYVFSSIMNWDEGSYTWHLGR